MARKIHPDDPALAAANPVQAIPAGAVMDRASLMPGLRARQDGWTAARAQRFLDTLAHTGCVRDAARVAGVSSTGAYRMKARFPAFSAAWEDALARARQGLIAIAYRRAVEGKETVIYRNGAEYERRVAPSDAILGLLIKQGDMSGQKADTPRTEAISFAEQEDGWYFDEQGKKRHDPNRKALCEKVEAKLLDLRMRIFGQELDDNCCRQCGGSLPDAYRAQLQIDYDKRFPVDPETGHRKPVRPGSGAG